MRIGRAVARRQDVLARDQRAELARLVAGDDPRRHAELVLQRHAARERVDLGLGGEQEEVADLLVVDLPARPLLEPLVRLEAALGDLDIERVRELGAQAAGGLRGRAAGQLIALEQDDLGAGLGEVEGGADADHAPTHDHDVGTGRQREARHAADA